MSQYRKIPSEKAKRELQADETWNYCPDLPLENPNIFAWPPKPLSAAKSLALYWFTLTGRVVILLIAYACWLFLHPDISRCLHFEAGWVTQIYLRNLFLLIAVAGGLHLYLYTYSRQGDYLKFDTRPMIKNSRQFSFNDQVKDNMFWSLVTGVLIWTFFEIFYMWLHANGKVPQMAWDSNIIPFLAMFVAIPLWYSFWFYWVHRALHWPPLYRLAHRLHHRNINVGPWSGYSMHPIEQLMYMGSIVIHLIIPSHPLHIMFHLQFNVLAAVFSHSGFENLVMAEKKRMDLGYFFHQLHHKYFECNYGTDEMPWDRWFGTFHNGSTEATKLIRRRRQKMHNNG